MDSVILYTGLLWKERICDQCGCHQAVFHVVADINDQLNTAYVQYIGQLLEYMPHSDKEFIEDNSGKAFVLEGIPYHLRLPR